MSTRADPADEAVLVDHARRLADAVDAAMAPWIAHCVARFLPTTEDVRAAVDAAAEQARHEVGADVRVLLETDVDVQRSTPLALLRGAVRYPTAILRDAGVPPVARDEFAVRAFPDDIYDLSPASFADVDPALADPGLVWGAAKAHVILQRRRREGRW
ncbi:MAG TPA: hypothetical protein VGQ20_16905 [Acidimicrobiales bacterium]|nr:hypothetical protein [Acidimicrobiales bacterium]